MGDACAQDLARDVESAPLHDLAVLFLIEFATHAGHRDPAAPGARAS